MQNTAFAGASAPRLYVLYDLWGREAARLRCLPAELPAQLEATPAYGLSADARAELSGCLSEMGGTGTHSATSAYGWLLTSKPMPSAVLVWPVDA